MKRTEDGGGKMDRRAGEREKIAADSQLIQKRGVASFFGGNDKVQGKKRKGECIKKREKLSLKKEKTSRRGCENTTTLSRSTKGRGLKKQRGEEGLRMA